MREVTLQEMSEVFEEVVDLSGITFDENSVLGEDLVTSSSQMLRIVSRLQNHYRVRFLPGDVLKVRTVGDLQRLINSRLASDGQ